MVIEGIYGIDDDFFTCTGKIL